VNRNIETLLSTRRFQVVRMRHQSADGVLHARDIVQHPGAVTIVPIVADKHVCLIRNYRVSVDESLVELPAGTLEPGENPIECARRELTEETGFRADRFEFLTSFYMSPGVLDEKMHLVLATGLVAGPPAREPGELIENMVVPWSTAMQMACDGTIQDAKTLVGLLHYDQTRSGE